MDRRDQLTSFETIFLYTVRKLLLSRRIYITLLILLFIVAIMAYASMQDLTESDIESGVTKLDVGVEMLDGLILFFFMPVMAMIYGSSLVRDEMDDKSITAVITSPMDRVLAFLAYYLGLAVSVTLIMWLILAGGFLAFFGNVGLGGTGEIFGTFIVLMIIGAFAYSALFIMVSVLMNQPIYFGLFYAFIWEALIGSIPGSIRLLAVKHYVRSLGAAWFQYGSISEYDATPVGDSAWVLIIFTAIAFFMGVLLFREKEFA